MDERKQRNQPMPLYSYWEQLGNQQNDKNIKNETGSMLLFASTQVYTIQHKKHIAKRQCRYLVEVNRNFNCKSSPPATAYPAAGFWACSVGHVEDQGISIYVVKSNIISTNMNGVLVFYESMMF